LDVCAGSGSLFWVGCSFVVGADDPPEAMLDCEK
jgi:hypothetical protein